LGTAPADTDTRLAGMAAHPSAPSKIQNTGWPTAMATAEAVEYLRSFLIVGDCRSIPIGDAA
jgi:hypothetical protein